MAYCLLDSFHNSHDESTPLDLASVEFEKESHQDANDVAASGGLRRRLGMYYEWGISQYFPMWHCRKGWCASAMETFAVSAEATDLGKKKTEHQAWEKKWCKCLMKGPFNIFHDVSTLAVRNDWPVDEMRVSHGNLDDVFRQITTVQSEAASGEVSNG